MPPACTAPPWRDFSPILPLRELVMSFDFSGKTAVITGAGSGIGAALARLAAAKGMKVVLADIRLEDASAVAAEIGADRSLALQTDVSDAASVADPADRAWERRGT